MRVLSEKDTVTIRVGAKRGQTVGTFVLFKDDRLMKLGKNFPDSFTRKYGSTVNFKKSDEIIPV